ncbi:MAG: SCO family protein [Hyphomicrobiales bacterium]|nr:SCO family protein [Hyphomicrobiales bacterium]
MTESIGSARPRGHLRVMVGVAAAAAIAAWVFVTLNLVTEPQRPPPADDIGGPFTLVGNGEKISDRDLLGKWLLVYFGYTHCPNICPMTLGEISATLKLLGPLASEVQPLFITIDPERDSAEAVTSFVREFDAKIIGLSGTPAQIAAVATKYHVYYAKAPSSVTGPEDYLMEHSAFIYVMGPNGKYVTLLSPVQGQTPDNMAARLRDLMTDNSAQSANRTSVPGQ